MWFDTIFRAKKKAKYFNFFNGCGDYKYAIINKQRCFSKEYKAFRQSSTFSKQNLANTQTTWMTYLQPDCLHLNCWQCSAEHKWSQSWQGRLKRAQSTHTEKWHHRKPYMTFRVKSLKPEKSDIHTTNTQNFGWWWNAPTAPVSINC